MRLTDIVKSKLFLTTSGILVFGILYWVFFTQDPIDYNTQVKPILNQKCISCHGGVKKKGGFSLLFREEAIAPTESGHPAIIPGDAKNSDMIKRLYHQDPEERMPYQEAPLSKNEIEILTRWIDEGARFDLHWAYRPVQLPSLPSNPWFGWFTKKQNNEIDRFIDEKLNDLNLTRTEEADKRTLLRRLSLDLIGTKAPENIATAYLQDDSPKAYENLVDSLLNSPRYGERWTALWMDLSRYADTKGYERDYIRDIWRYRDWLIQAFNRDMPYDQFLIEQLAGDLLPNPSDEQFIATAYHRNTMTNDEGGTDNEEYRTAAIIDRVNTTWETLMGTSFSCVQCHSHPYDPIRHDEYYKFMAFFNNSRDEDTYDEYPLLREFKNKSKLQFDSVMQFIGGHGNATQIEYFKRLLKTGQFCINSIIADSMVNSALEDTKFLRMRKQSLARFKNIDFTGYENIVMRFRSPIDKGILTIHPDHPDAKPIATIPLNQTKDGWNLIKVKIQNPISNKHDLYFRFNSPLLKKPEDNGVVFDWFAFTPEFPKVADAPSPYYENLFLNLLNKPEADFTPIMLDNPTNMKRPTYVFERGNWLLKTNIVEPGIPSVFATTITANPKNRMDLARWMTDKKNPLTARTMVNRIWEQLYGQGIVETLEDLGSQGGTPTHQDLLDFISYQFMNEDGWSIKKLLKRIVISATYRQSSTVSKEAKEKDPLNKYYAHAPRVRLTAEQIRDQALAISGMLSSKMYGPSVMPYQPEGIWSSPYDERKWKQSEGEDQYRRGIYTYWKRTGPYPSMITFDGSAREVCLTRRISTNTPLQALTLLNDSTYWDLSVQLAKKLMTDKNSKINQRIAKGYEWATGHPIHPEKEKILISLYTSTLQNLGKDTSRIKSMLSDSLTTPYQKEFAALSVVTNAILNLDEVITKN